jgi:peptide/nickel transport system substrate-binding protein
MMAIAVLVAFVGACTSGGGADAVGGHPTDEPRHGGEVVVLLDGTLAGSWPSGLDPGTNATARGNLTQMSAIYSGLFRLVADVDGSNARVVGHQAKSWRLTDKGQSCADLRPRAP